MSQWTELRQRMAGRWQIPLFAGSLVLLAAGLYRLRPSPETLPLAAAIDFLDSLLASGAYGQAVELGQSLAQRKDELGADGEAQVRLRLARALAGGARASGAGGPSVGEAVAEHLGFARAGGLTLSPDDWETLGWAQEAQGKPESAIDTYRQAIARGHPQASDLRQRCIVLAETLAETTPEVLAAQLDEMLGAVEAHRLDLHIWALERKLYVLEELGRLGDAATLLVKHRKEFEKSDYRDAFAFLEAYLLFAQGHADEAENFLRAVRNRLERRSPLYAKTGWLLGRIVLHDGGPQRPLEALSFFQDVRFQHPGDEYALASLVGSAEALAYLERHEEAIEAYEEAIERLEAVGDRRWINVGALRTSLSVMAEGLRQTNQVGPALSYARLAGRLLDETDVEQATPVWQQVGQLQELYGEELERAARDAEESDRDSAAALAVQARDQFADAADTYLRLAQLSIAHEERAAQASWLAAELMARGGRLQAAARLYERYAQERPASVLVPGALLRVGQLRQAMGQWLAAADAYRECYRRFPRTLDGARSLIPLAQCFLALGPAEEEAAEKVLSVVLDESEVFTPEAPEFADALFLLGEVLNRRGEPERAIVALEEALERYPDDERAWRGRFLLADSYRRSALALREAQRQGSYEGEIEQMGAESDRRLTRALKLYNEVIEGLEGRGLATLNRLERLYLHLASLYEADCTFEMRDYREAIRLYEEAATSMKDTPRGLAAFVQIINCHVFLGQLSEARAALARALIQVDAMPAEAFSRSVSPERREDWQRYFQWLGESSLF